MRCLRRGREVEIAVDHERLDLRGPHLRVEVLVRVGGPAVEETAAGPEEVGGGAADDRALTARLREVALRISGVGPRDRCGLALQLDIRERQLGERREEPEPARVTVLGGQPRADRHRRGDRRGRSGRVHQAEERADLRVARLDPQKAPAVGHVPGGRAERRGEVVRPRAAPLVVDAQGGVLLDLRVVQPWVPDEVARRVHSDQHRAVDALRVAPRVDQCGARPHALAEQVDGPVPERAARGLEVVYSFRQGVTGEIDPVLLQAGGAIRKAVAVGVVERGAAEVARVLHCRDGLPALQLLGAVHAAVADQHDVAVAGEPARVREVHVRQARSTLQPEDRLSGIGRDRLDPLDRQRDQPRMRVMPILGHDQGAAVGGIAALLGRVRARVQRQLAGVRPLRHRDLARA